MYLTEVTNYPAERQFLEMPVSIYQHDPNWVRPLDQDIEAVFDQDKNKLFQHGAACRWILRNESGKLIGRVAAFVDENTARNSEYVTGGMGFFECEDDPQAARMLFDACKNWLMERGMEAMDGPINFGDRQSWWGLLVEGFHPPTYQMNYNPPYYRPLFEDYGFQVYFNQYVFNYEVDKPIPPKILEKAERVFKSPAFRFEHFRKKKLESYAADLTKVYNEGWAAMAHFKPVSVDQTVSTMKKMLPVMDERLIWFGYFRDRPVAFFVMLPEINQVIRRLNGRMDWWGKLQFLYYQRSGVIHNMFGVLFGVVPEFQGKGIDGAVICAAARVIQPLKKYRNLEMNWVGDFNPKMVKMVQGLETKILKKYITYRKIFDPAKPFFRAPIVE